MNAKIFRQQLQYYEARNRALILNMIKEEGGISRAELSKRTGLSRGGITPIINELLGMELIAETGVSGTDSGRRPIILELNASGCHAIAVDLTRKKFTAAVVDFTGRIVTQEQYWFVENDTLDHILKRLKETINSLLSQQELRELPESGIGCSRSTGYIHWGHTFTSQFLGLAEYSHQTDSGG